MEHCDFCGIAATEPKRIIKANNPLVTSFLSNPSLGLGHALVIPKRHMTLPQDLSDNEIVAMHREADRLTKVMLGDLGLKGVDRWQKTRPDMPENAIKRNHVHLHVLPSNPGEQLHDQGIIWGGTEADWQPLADADRDRWLAALRPPTFD